MLIAAPQHPCPFVNAVVKRPKPTPLVRLQGHWELANVFLYHSGRRLGPTWGAAYHYKEADRTLIQKAQKAALSDMANARASLPKWDDKNYKGLTHRPSR